jgi:hypothetical protein
MFCISVNPQADTGFSTIWGYVGPLVGVCLGAFLGWGIQRSQWTADNKKREYQALLTTLLRAHNAAQLLYSAGATHFAPEVLRAYTNDLNAAGVVFEDRVFIGKKLKELDLKNRWESALGHLRSTHNHLTFEAEFEQIKQEILKAAQ